MKRLMLYIGLFLFLSLFFTAGYYLSYINLKDDYETEGKNQDLVLSDMSTDNSPENEFIRSEAVKEAVTEDYITVRPSTAYVLETYNNDNGTILCEKMNPTSDFIGLTRQEIIDYLTLYMENIPLTEYEKGLISYELVSFSPKEFKIKKVYDKSLIPYKFYLTLKDNYVIIYYSDLKTVYDYTLINGNSIDYADKIALLKGFYVEDSEELFAILEGYTS